MKNVFRLSVLFLLMSLLGFGQEVVSIPVTTNGKILSIYHSDGINYIGGNFSQVSPITGSAVMLNKINSTTSISLPKVNGSVYCAVSDGNGGIYIGGNFSKVGNHVRYNIAHINELGEVTNWAPVVESDNLPIVYSLAKDGDFIYFGGSFRSVNQQSRNFIARVDIEGNLSNWNPNPNDEVYTIEINDGKIYFGGNFNTIGSTDRFKIACVNSLGVIENWYPLINNQVKKIKFFENKIYIAGGFTNVNNYTRQRFAVLDLDGNLTSFALNFNQRVEDFAILNNKIYFGGRFTKVNNISKSYVVCSDLDGTLQNWNISPNSFVYSVANSDDMIYLGGAFNKINNTNRNFLASVTENAQINNWDPNPNSLVFSILPFEQTIFLGGAFMGIGGIARNNFAAFNELGELQDINIDANGEVLAVYKEDDILYIGGNFSKINNIDRKYLASVDLTGNVLDWNPNLNSSVYTMAKIGNELFVGGTFSKIGNNNRYFAASFDNNGVLTDWAPQFNGPVFSIKNNASDIYVGGFFNRVNDETRINICSFSENKILNEWNPIVNDAVLTMCVFENVLYIGGWFNTINDLPRSRIASFLSDGSLSDWNPVANNSVWTIHASSNSNGIIYVGGDFTMLNSTEKLYIGAFDALGNLQDWAPNPNKSVYSIQAGEDAIYSGGIFTSFGNLLSPNLATLKFDYVPPQMPIQLFPTNLQAGLPLIFTFDWTTALYAGKYHLQVSETPQFSTLIIDDENIPQSQYLVNEGVLNFETQYFWRVRSSNGLEFSDWSSVWTFGTVISPPQAPVLNLPENNAEEQLLSPLFTWADNLNTDSYQIQISDDENFANILFDVEDIAINEFQLFSNLQKTTQYFWKVRAKNISGYGDWSSIFNFTTAEYQVLNLSLKKGWNWSSINVTPLNTAVTEIMKDVATDLVIMKNAAGQAYMPPSLNTIINWNFKEGYQIYMNNATTLTVLGMPVNPVTTPIYLKRGWNMISYLRNTPQNIAISFASLVEKGRMVIAKNAEGKIFMPPTNTIGNLIPGNAYQLYLSEPDTLYYPANGVGKFVSNDADDYQAKINLVKFPLTNNFMNIAIKNIAEADGTEILAFSPSGNLVGSSSIYNNFSILTIWGDDNINSINTGINDNLNIILKLYDLKSGQFEILNEYSCKNVISNSIEELKFNKDAVLEVDFNQFENAISINCTPNPVTNQAKISFVGKFESLDYLEIYDLNGKLIDKIETNSYSNGEILINTTNYSSGEYSIVAKSGKITVKTKMIVIK